MRRDDGVGTPGQRSSRELERLTDELARTARATAALLTTVRYDEAELAELDVRARALRAAIAEERRKLGQSDEQIELTCRYPKTHLVCGS